MKCNYRGYCIEQNEFGSFNCAAINCFSSPTLDSATRAIDAHLYRRRQAENDAIPRFSDDDRPEREPFNDWPNGQGTYD